MASTVNRTHYNSLVDDDGSGNTGSVWDKADVDGILDAVDDIFSASGGVDLAGGLRERNRSIAMGVWADEAFDAGNFINCTVVGTDVVTNRWMLLGKTLTWALYIDGLDVAAATFLNLTLPNGFLAARWANVGVGVGGTAFTPIVGTTSPNATVVVVRRVPEGTWAVANGQLLIATLCIEIL